MDSAIKWFIRWGWVPAILLLIILALRDLL